jgi:hypothetical protein
LGRSMTRKIALEEHFLVDGRINMRTGAVQ